MMKSFIYIITAVFFTTLSIYLFITADQPKLKEDIAPPITAHQEPLSNNGSDNDMVAEAQRFVQGIVPNATIIYDPNEIMIFGMAYNDTNTIRLSRLYKAATPEERTYILCHEASHLLTSGDHDAAFYATLEPLVVKYGVSWETARRLEQTYPANWNNR